MLACGLSVQGTLDAMITSRKEPIKTNIGISTCLVSGILLLGIACSSRASEQTTYYVTNAQGTVVAEMDTQSNVTYQSATRPYGKQSLGTPQAGPGYTGHVNDPDTGLVYMQARYYDPMLGRFLSTDPVQVAPGNIFGFGRYVYANNNPYRYTDPTGKFAFFIHMWLTFRAAHAAGYRLLASLHYALQAGWADLRPHAQDVTAQAVAQHGMSILHESVGTARRNWENLIERDLEQGKLGYASHAIQDPYARKHHGFQEWNGKLFSIKGFEHMWADITPTHKNLNSAYEATVALLRAARDESQESGSSDGNQPAPAADPYASQGMCGFMLIIGCNDPSQILPDRYKNNVDGMARRM